MKNKNLCECGNIKVECEMVGFLPLLKERCDACQLALDRDQKINDILNGKFIRKV